MEISSAAADDLAHVCALRLAFLREVRDLDPGEVTPTMRASTASFVGDGHANGTLHSWLAHDDADVLGLVSLLLTPAPPLPDDARTRDGLVLNMYVRPEVRSVGTGAALMDACTAGARALGVRRLGLYATEAGRPLYVASGFRTNDDWMERRLG